MIMQELRKETVKYLPSRQLNQNNDAAQYDELISSSTVHTKETDREMEVKL